MANKEYISFNQEFLQRNDLSLGARGLLAYLESLPDDAVFDPATLHESFEKNDKDSVESAWNELLENHFIIALPKGDASLKEHDYYFSQEGFSEEEIKEIQANYLDKN